MINLKEIKNKIIIKNNIYSLLIILIIFLLDRYTKIFILNNFSDNTFYLNDFINLDLVWNTGIAFGLLSFNTQFIYNLITLTIGLVIFVLVFICLTSKNIDIHYNNFHWFTFNLADIFIVFGIMVYLIQDFYKKKIK